MPSTLSQNIASAEGEPQPFLKAQKCLINLTLPISFHFIMPCNLRALVSRCPPDAASHLFGGRALDESPENFNLTLISTPLNTHHCQINSLSTVSVNVFSPADSAFQFHTWALCLLLTGGCCISWFSHGLGVWPGEGLALWVSVAPSLSTAVQAISSIQEKYSMQQEDEVEDCLVHLPLSKIPDKVKSSRSTKNLSKIACEELLLQKRLGWFR